MRTTLRERALTRLWILGIILALAGVVKAIDARRPPRAEKLLYLPDKNLLKILACGHGPTMADVAWIRATGYVLDEFKQGKAHIEHLYELFDAMTELDPNFVEAYEAGALFLASIAARPDAAERLIEKGEGRLIDDGKEMRPDPAFPGLVHPSNPRRWKLAVMRASIHLVSYAGDADTGEQRAAEIRKAGRIYFYAGERYPAAHDAGYGVAGAVLRDKRYDALKAAKWELAIWDERARSGNDAIRALATRRRNEAASELNRIQLQQLVDAFTARRGHPPARLDELGVALPEDPLGVGYRLEGARVRARGVEAAAVARSLDRAIATFREKHGRAPARLDELDPPPAIPADVAVDYDPATGAVTARPR